MIEMYSQLRSEYPLVSIEQPFHKDDWEHSEKFTTLELCQVVGDDMLISDPERIKRVVNEYTCDALTLKVQKTFSSNIVGPSSRHGKCTLNIIMQVIQIRQLVHALKKGTLKELVTEMLIWVSAEEVLGMDDASQLFEALNAVMLKILGNTDTTSFFVILIKLLVPLDHSRWPSCTPLDLLAVKNNRLPDLAVKNLRILKENLENTLNDLELDLILHSIHDFLEPLGRKEIQIRAENDDMPLQVVISILGGLVKLVGSEIKGHLSMVPIDADHGPIILGLIDRFLEVHRT